MTTNTTTTTMTLGDRLKFGLHMALSFLILTALSIVAIAMSIVWFDPPALVTVLLLVFLPMLAIRAYWHVAGLMPFGIRL